MSQGSNPNSLIGLKIGWELASLRRNPTNKKTCVVCGNVFDKRGIRKRSHCSVKCKAISQKKEGTLTKQENNRMYRKKNLDKLTIKSKIYRENNRGKRNKYQNEKRRTDPVFKLRLYLRNRVNKVISRNQKGGSAVRDLGCSVVELKFYLEGKFTDGMTWENHGKWHIDHVIPLTFYDLTNREQFKRAVHYTNLQPLWALDNIRKNNKYEVQTSI